MSGRNAFGLSENVACTLCYLLGYVTGIVFLVAEKDNKTIRFHALQSIVWFGALAIISAVVQFLFGWVFLLGGLTVKIIVAVQVISWLYLMFSAYMGRTAKLPVVGDVVWAQVNK